MAIGKHETKKSTAANALSEAFGEFQSLAEEMADWADKIEERFSQTEKYERVRAAQETLEQLQEPECPAKLKDVEIEYTQGLPKSKRSGLSRADRCSNATIILDVLIEICAEAEDDDELSSFADELENAKSEAEGVEFPSMFG